MRRSLTLFLLSTIIPIISFPQDLSDFFVGGKTYLPPPTLEKMVEYVKDMNANSAPRNEIASWLAIVIDHRVTNMNSPERVLDWRNTFSSEGQELFDEWRDQNIYDNITSAEWAWSNGMGNCEENANIVYYILKKAGLPKDFRMLTTGHHQFTVWGLAPGADLGNPDTWGPDAIVVDPWLGYTVDSDGVKSGRWFQNGDETISITDQTFNFDKKADRWVTSTENSSLKASTDEDCFVATAAYGTSLAVEIQILREFRDKHMRAYVIGNLFIDWYEKNGPKLAAFLNEYPILKPLVRQYFLEPIIQFLKNHTNESDC